MPTAVQSVCQHYAVQCTSGLDRYSMDGQLQKRLHTGGMQDYIRPSSPSDRPSEEASACSSCAPGPSKLLHIHQPAQDAHHRHAHRPGRHHGSRHFVNSHRANDVLPPGFATRAGQQHVLDDEQVRYTNLQILNFITLNALWRTECFGSVHPPAVPISSGLRQFVACASLPPFRLSPSVQRCDC